MHVQPNSLFGDLSEEQFLKEYWQQKPLFVKNAVPDFSSPLDPGVLLELAMRDDADSRLIIEEGGSYAWEARFGPFDQQDFDSLPETHWTLLVQEVDRLVPGVARMLDSFSFLPNWRFDDIMVSYARDQGGVGAHIDNYDVFLIQGDGSRRWQISSEPILDENLVPDLDIRILADFEPKDEYIVEPGDMLYLPPRFAHYGVAQGDCMTFSIGCRAPSAKEIVASYLEQWLEAEESDAPFTGAYHVTTDAPGRVTAELKAFARESLKTLAQGEHDLERWMGRYLSRAGRGWPPATLEAPITFDELAAGLNNGRRIRPATPSQVLFDRLTDGSLYLYAGGREYRIDSDLEKEVAALTGRIGLGGDAISVLTERKSFRELLLVLINEGYFRIEV